MENLSNLKRKKSFRVFEEFIEISLNIFKSQKKKNWKKGAKNDYYEQMAWLTVIYWQSDLFFNVFFRLSFPPSPAQWGWRLQNKHENKTMETFFSQQFQGWRKFWTFQKSQNKTPIKSFRDNWLHPRHDENPIMNSIDMANAVKFNDSTFPATHSNAD